MLLEPLKSADPPINSGRFLVISSITLADACLEAILSFASKKVFLTFVKTLSKSLGNLLFKILESSSLIFLLFLL